MLVMLMVVITGTEGCGDPVGAPAAGCGAPAGESATGGRERLHEWTRRWQELRESVDSEWNAAFEAFSTPGTASARKWLGWALYRLAARVNPEIRD